MTTTDKINAKLDEMGGYSDVADAANCREPLLAALRRALESLELTHQEQSNISVRDIARILGVE